MPINNYRADWEEETADYSQDPNPAETMASGSVQVADTNSGPTLGPSEGQTPELSNFALGQTGGSDKINLTEDNLHSHSHSGAGHGHDISPHTHEARLMASQREPSKTVPGGHALATWISPTSTDTYATAGDTTVLMADNSLSVKQNFETEYSSFYLTGETGGSEPINHRPPFYTLRHCLSSTGSFY